MPCHGLGGRTIWQGEPATVTDDAGRPENQVTTQCRMLMRRGRSRRTPPDSVYRKTGGRVAGQLAKQTSCVLMTQLPAKDDERASPSCA